MVGSRRAAFSAAMALVASLVLGTSALADRGYANPIPLTNPDDGTVTGLTSTHELASDGERLHLVYPRNVPGTFSGQLVYRRSLDAGRTWEPERALFSTDSHLTDLMGNLAIAAHGDLVVVAFRSHTAGSALLFVRASHDGGATWAPRVKVASVTTSLRMGIPSIVISSAGVLIAWTNRANGRIYSALSSDGAQTFRAAQWLATTRYTFACGQPSFTDGLVSLGASGMNVELVWIADPNADCITSVLKIRRSLDGGRTWDAARSLAGTQNTFGWPEIATQGNVIIVFVEALDYSTILLRSTDAGASFSSTRLRASQPNQRLAGGDVAFGGAGTAQVVIDIDTFDESGTMTSSGMLSYGSHDGGASWGKPALVHMAPTGLSDFTPNIAFVHGDPTIAFDASNADVTKTTVFALSRFDRTVP